MSIDERERADFETALGESFAEAVCPPVAFEDASPHECAEAVRSALGPDVTPELLATLIGDGVARLQAAFGDHFECEPPTGRQIETGLARTLARWPADPKS